MSVPKPKQHKAFNRQMTANSFVTDKDFPDEFSDDFDDLIAEVNKEKVNIKQNQVAEEDGFFKK